SFFTTALLIGYLYAHWLIQKSATTQRRVHGYLLAASAIIAAVVALLISLGADVPAYLGVGNLPPAVEIILLLVCTVGIPAVALAATNTLVQHWSYKDEGTYRLYALSNAGSFVGLLSYPFVVEPLLSVPFQSLLWGIAFVVFAIQLRSFIKRGAHAQAAEATHERADWSMRLLWLTLAAFPALLMVATTAQITHVVAPIPLLWMVPLGLYLLSYVLAFSGRGGGMLSTIFFVATAWGSLMLLDAGVSAFMERLVVYLGFLFFASLVLHAHLFKSRPRGTHLSLFYFYVSLGGALGTLLISFGAPLAFNDLWEFPLAVIAGVVLSTLFLLYALIQPRFIWAARILAVGFIFIAGNHFYEFTQANFGFEGTERNFYGITMVYKTDDKVSLYHEETLHGTQFTSAEDSGKPTTYYSLHGAVGRSFGYERVVAHPDQPLNVAIIGLGSGTVAAYCRPGDTFVYYEIDRRMERIARNDFTYLSKCPGAEVRIGDARRVMEQEVDAGATGVYDILIIDAFNDDNIPAHLVTLEALETYERLMRHDDSIIAFHTSNRYLELAPLIISLAKSKGFAAVIIEGGGEDDLGGTSSEWVLLSKKTDAFKRELFLENSAELPTYLPSPWTDTYSNILPIISVRTSLIESLTEKIVALGSWSLSGTSTPAAVQSE
ncbi:MAG: hypothetical protein KBE09_05750, partial [Candidatus Pacebacteria bacterium]|nr:hypothetical protein [Candidatus Paceibacterota bacterium]